MATTNITPFDLALAKYGRETIPSRARDRVQVIAMHATRSLVEKTPRDTGMAKGNWQVTVGDPAEGSIERTDASPAGSASSSPAMRDTERALSGWRPGEFVWLHNGLPYIHVLEVGTLGRPANHMLLRTFTELKAMVGR